MFFDDDQNKDITNKTPSPLRKEKKSKSPRKREPSKNVQMVNESVDDKEMEKSETTNESVENERSKCGDDEKSADAGQCDAVRDANINDDDKRESQDEKHPIETNDNRNDIEDGKQSENPTETGIKRRLSGTEGEIDDADNVKDCIEDIETNCHLNKKLKLDSCREQMYQVCNQNIHG